MLDSNAAWIEILSNARSSMANGLIHNSPNHAREYSVLDVEDSKITIERTGKNGKQRKPLTRNTAIEMIERLNKNPTGCPKNIVLADRDYYLINMLVDLHPQIQWGSGDLVIIV